MKVQIAGAPTPKSDADVARFLERFLEGEHPGTSWHTREGLEHGSPLEAAPRKGKVGPGGPYSQGSVAV